MGEKEDMTEEEEERKEVKRQEMGTDRPEK